MQIHDLEKITQQSCEAVEKVAAFIRQELGQVNTTEIEVKSYNSLVSYVDKTAEEKLVAALQNILPDAGFLTEEETIDTKESTTYRWIIDPLDGTTNFLHQLPHFAISVALQYQDQMVIGIVYDVTKKECFYAWKGGGAYLNTKSIQVSPTTILQDALLATGFPYYDYSGLDACLSTLRTFMTSTRGIRRYGAAALDLVYVACGRYDAYYEYSLHPWDVAAGALIVQEAGGLVVDFKGGDDYLFGSEIIAGAPGTFNEVVKVIKDAYYPPSSK